MNNKTTITKTDRYVDSPKTEIKKFKSTEEKIEYCNSLFKELDDNIQYTLDDAVVWCAVQVQTSSIDEKRLMNYIELLSKKAPRRELSKQIKKILSQSKGTPDIFNSIKYRIKCILNEILPIMSDNKIDLKIFKDPNGSGYLITNSELLFMEKLYAEWYLDERNLKNFMDKKFSMVDDDYLEDMRREMKKISATHGNPISESEIDYCFDIKHGIMSNKLKNTLFSLCFRVEYLLSFNSDKYSYDCSEYDEMIEVFEKCEKEIIAVQNKYSQKNCRYQFETERHSGWSDIELTELLDKISGKD